MSSEIPWVSTVADAVARARDVAKPIFIFLYSPTCQGSAATQGHTYVDPSVIDLLSSEVIPCKIDRKDPQSADTVAEMRHVWTPDFRLVDAGGYDHYRWHGFLPPAEFAAKLLVGLGRMSLQREDWGGAEQHYLRVAEGFPTSAYASEALYYLAVSRFKVSGQRGDLEATWKTLAARYPGSTWRIRQVFGERL